MSEHVNHFNPPAEDALLHTPEEMPVVDYTPQVRGELKALHGAFNDFDRMNDAAISGHLRVLEGRADSPAAAQVPGMKYVLESAVFGAMVDPGRAQEFYAAKLRPDVALVAGNNDKALRLFDSLAQTQVEGLRRGAGNPATKQNHKHQMTERAESDVRQLQTYESDPLKQRQLETILRSFQLGASPAHARSQFARKVEDLLLGK